MLSDRVDRLERQNRRLRFALSGLPLVALLLGAGSLQVDDWKGKSVTAERFVLVDSHGQRRAALLMEKDGPNFTLEGDKGQTRVRIAADSEGSGPAIFLVSDKGQVAAVLRHIRKGSPLLPHGGPAMALCTEDGKYLVYMGQNGGNGIGFIQFHDNEGKFKGGYGGDALK
jgi:hypothetical protein